MAGYCTLRENGQSEKVHVNRGNGCYGSMGGGGSSESLEVNCVALERILEVSPRSDAFRESINAR